MEGKQGLLQRGVRNGRDVTDVSRGLIEEMDGVIFHVMHSTVFKSLRLLYGVTVSVLYSCLPFEESLFYTCVFYLRPKLHL